MAKHCYSPTNEGQSMSAGKDELARKVESDFSSMKSDLAEKDADPVSSIGKTGPTYRNATPNPIHGRE